MPNGYLKVIESIPVHFIRRSGDWSQEGGNNTLIVMGTDRCVPSGPASIDDGLGRTEADGGGKGTGTIIAVAGRKDLKGGNPDINADDATLYISQKTKVDENLGTTFETTDTGPAVAVKSDHLRAVFRKNLKIAAVNKASHLFMDDDRLHVDMQGKAKILLDVSGDESSATIDIQGNTIVLKSDGTLTVTTKSKVTVNTQNATVNASESTTVNTPELKITGPGNTTIDGTLTVQGATQMAASLDVAGMSTLAAGTVTPMLTAGPTVVSAGGMTTSGQVAAGGVSIAGKDYAAHKHQEHGKGGGITGPPIV